jgi:hypothetical protein
LICESKAELIDLVALCWVPSREWLKFEGGVISSL